MAQLAMASRGAHSLEKLLTKFPIGPESWEGDGIKIVRAERGFSYDTGWWEFTMVQSLKGSVALSTRITDTLPLGPATPHLGVYPAEKPANITLTRVQVNTGTVPWRGVHGTLCYLFPNSFKKMSINKKVPQTKGFERKKERL